MVVPVVAAGAARVAAGFARPVVMGGMKKTMQTTARGGAKVGSRSAIRGSAGTGTATRDILNATMVQDSMSLLDSVDQVSKSSSDPAPGKVLTAIRDGITNLGSIFSSKISGLNKHLAFRLETLNNTMSKIGNIAAKDLGLEQVQTNIAIENEKDEDQDDSLSGGDETKDEYLQFLSNIFDSRKQPTINWKCNLIKLLRNGIAPVIDQEKLSRESIPTGPTLEKFLKNLVQNKIVNKQNIASFVIGEDYHWMYSYIDKPQWLKDEFERRDLMANKEKDYQKWMNNNLHKVESGLLKEEREMSMETGTIDFFCRDVNGQPVGLELKYPKATKSDGKQIIAYAKEQRDLPGGENFRGIMIAPEIHDGLKKLLVEQSLEYKEVIWNDEENNLEEEKNYDVQIDRTMVSENENSPVSESLEDTFPNGFETKEEPIKFSKGTLPKGF